MQKIQGIVQQGNTKVITGGLQSSTLVQGSFPLATVTVFNEPPVSVNITSIARAANVVTVTFAAPPGFIQGQIVTIAGVTDISYNGSFPILTAIGSQITYSQVGANGNSSGGTAASVQLATIFADNNNTPLSNPFASDSKGNWGFFAASGVYDVMLSGGGLSSPYTLLSLSAFDPTTAFKQPFSGAVSRPINNKMIETISLADFGAVGDGVTDDTGAILNAIATGKNIVGTPGGVYKFTSSLIMSTAGQVFSAGGYTSGQTNPPNAFPPVYLLKHGNFDGIILSGNSCQLYNIHIQGDVGNGGDGIQLTGNNCCLTNVSSIGHGNDGIRVGQKVSSGVGDGNTNTNLCEFINVNSNANTRDGFHIEDSFNRIDASQGRVFGLSCIGNGRHGIYSVGVSSLTNAVLDWVFFGVFSSSNIGRGVFVDNGCIGMVFFDPYCEVNTQKPEIYFASDTTKCSVFNVRAGALCYPQGGVGGPIMPSNDIGDDGTANFIMARVGTDIALPNLEFNGPYISTVLGLSQLVIQNRLAALSRFWNLQQNISTYNLELAVSDTSATTVDFLLKHNFAGGVIRLSTPQLRVIGNGSTSNIATLQLIATSLTTYMPAGLAPGASDVHDVTVSGALVNSDVKVSFSNDLVGVILSGQVVGTGQVRIRFYNPTAGTINLASGTLRVSCDVYTP